MKLVFVSNYISHHQIPFCDACYRELGEDFSFVELMPMEEERRRMGWNADEALPYVRRLYESAGTKQGSDDSSSEALGEIHRMILDCDVLLFGGMDREELVYERMALGAADAAAGGKDRPVIRISERIYKDGQWKAVSPCGLLHKYQEFTRYHSRPYYLLCAGAYVASDFAIIRAFPGKKYRWGYFPETKRYESWEALAAKKPSFPVGDESRNLVRILWTGRFVDFKHIEEMAALSKRLLADFIPAHPETELSIEIIGSGEQEAAVRAELEAAGKPGVIEMPGFLAAEKVRAHMECADILVFTSDQGEGWGAVVNEAMNSGCAVVASNQAGSVPSLIRDGVNGRIYRFGDREALYRLVTELIEQPQLRQRLGRAAYETVTGLWNAETAAGELLRFCRSIVNAEAYMPPQEGPMSIDPGLKPFLKVSS